MYQRTGSHEWIIEFERLPDNVELFKNTLDESLKKYNSDYEAKRYKNMALRFPVIHIAPDGTFYNWLKQRGKLGGQHKVPRLANDRKYLDEVLEIINNAVELYSNIGEDLTNKYNPAVTSVAA